MFGWTDWKGSYDNSTVGVLGLIGAHLCPSLCLPIHLDFLLDEKTELNSQGITSIDLPNSGPFPMLKLPVYLAFQSEHQIHLYRSSLVLKSLSVLDRIPLMRTRPRDNRALQCSLWILSWHYLW